MLKLPRTRPRRLALAALALLLLAAPAAAENAWNQWGGPHRDFHTEGAGLASSWGDGGPKLLWERPLGDGYSAITAGAHLYTMYHADGEEVVVAVDPATGETVWEKRFAIVLPEDMALDFGPGPMSTPALAGGRLFTAGTLVSVRAFDAGTGELLWSHELKEEMETPQPGRGFGNSPLLHGDLVIFAVGSQREKEGGVVAFRQDNGELVWKSGAFRGGYSSPILARVDGEEQIFVAMGSERAGLDPKTGEVIWKLALRQDSRTIMSTQIWNEEEQILFGSSAYADGSRAIQVTKKDGAFVAEELWYTRKMRVQHTTAVRLGDLIYGSSGDFGPAFLTAVDVKTGELAFRQRGFAKANLLRVGDRVVLLDEEGELALATPGPEGLEIHSQVKILEKLSWTVPTLVGTHLYVRDRKHMKAFDLGS